MPSYSDAELEALVDNNSLNKGGGPRDGSQTPDTIESESLSANSAREELGDKLKNLLLSYGDRYEAPNYQPYTEYNPNINVKAKFVPKKLYFYYFKFSTNGALISRVFAADINANTLKSGDENDAEFHREIIKKIKHWVSNHPEKQITISKNDLIEINPDKVLWREACYLTFMLDEEAWEFYQSETGNDNNALHFPKQVLPQFIEVMDHKKKIKTNGETCSNKHKCFCNSRILNHGSLRPILLIENRHISFKTGKTRKNNDKTYDIYKFDLFFRVSTSPETYDDEGNEKKLTMIIDPTGTNFGPP